MADSRFDLERNTGTGFIPNTRSDTSLAELIREPMDSTDFLFRAMQRLRATDPARREVATVRATLPDGTQVQTEVPAEEANDGALNNIAAQLEALGATDVTKDYLGGNFTTQRQTTVNILGQELPTTVTETFAPRTSSKFISQREIEAGERARVAPRFTKENVLPLWNNLPPLTRVAFQEKAVEAGLLGSATGDFTPKTQQILEGVLGLANVEGISFREATDRYFTAIRADSGGTGEAPKRPTFVRPAYVPPDWAAVAQDVKTYAESRLGYKLRDWEVKLLGDEMAADHRRAYEQIVDQGRMDFDAAVRAQDTDGGEVTTPSAGPEVDPTARFRERFEELYGGAIETEQDEDALAQRHQLLIQSLTQGDRIFGGM